MHLPLLSVFIPVYNAEKYLEQCLDSVMNQSLSDFELYIHNDGSTDRSYDICCKYAEKDDRIHLTTGPNGGRNENMNLFLKQAKGDFICFIDNDDYIDRDYFERMVRSMQRTGADCAVAAYTLVDSDGNVLPWYTPKLMDGAVLSRQEILRRFLTTLDVEGFWWNKCYRRTVISENALQFPEKYPVDINGEFLFLQYVQKVVLVGSNGYYYRQSSTSEVATCSVEGRLRFIETFRAIGIQAAELGLKREGNYFRIWRSVNLLFTNWKSRHAYPSEQWNNLRKTCSWRKCVEEPLLKTLIVVSQYRIGRESRLKFLIKTMIVWFVFR